MLCILYSIMQPNSHVEEQITELQTKFYNETQKRRLFKNNQKLECASTIVQNIDLTTLLSSCIYIVQDKNEIYIDYPKLKMFVCPNIYSQIVEYATRLANTCVNKYQVFSLHINLQSFTITAAQRYHDLIELFCKKCFQPGAQFQTQLQQIHLYNYPTVIPILNKLFASMVDDSARGKLVLEKKPFLP